MSKRIGKREILVAVANRAIKEGKTVLYVSLHERPLELNHLVRHQVIEPIPYPLIKYTCWDE